MNLGHPESHPAEAHCYDPNATGDELWQNDERVPASVFLGGPLPVKIEGAVMTRALPTKLAGIRSEQLYAANPPVRILTADPRRAKATLIPGPGAGILIGEKQNSAIAGSGALLAVGQPFVFTAADELWAACTSDTTVAIITEAWSG